MVAWVCIGDGGDDVDDVARSGACLAGEAVGLQEALREGLEGGACAKEKRLAVRGIEGGQLNACADSLGRLHHGMSPLVGVRETRSKPFEMPPALRLKP